MHTTAYYHVDAFSSNPFAGNPAGVCLLEAEATEAWMQLVAAEMKLSATAFVVRDGEGHSLRWFTPTTELGLCGHATLAAAHVLWEGGFAPADEPISFAIRGARLTARRSDEWVELDLPAKPVVAVAADPSLAGALGVATIRDVASNGTDLLVELDNEEMVRSLAPHFPELARVQTRAVIVTARADQGRPYDFVSRFFAPAIGVPEDPVTGSAHCCLGPYWGRRLDRTALEAHQASQRGGRLRIRLNGDRVLVSGQAVIVFRGHLLVTGQVDRGLRSD